MSMKYVAAYALASLSKPNPSEADVETICKSVGIEVDKNTLAFVMESIAGRDIATLISEGAAKMAASAVSAPAGGSAAAAAPAAGGAAAPAAAAKKEEPEEEGDDDMGFGLFD